MTHRQTTPRFAVAQLPNGLWSVQYKGVPLRSYDKRGWAIRMANKLNNKEDVGLWLRHQAAKIAAAVDD